MKHKCWLVWGSHIVLTGAMWSISGNSFSEHHFMTSAALAQTIQEDATLGSESSRVNRNVTIRSIQADLIDRGARRGANLFHSFGQFDIPANRGAYFSNPTGVERIFSRVTGSDRSEILGRLGVLGNADLFFINPNGILFGANASLDMGGSFAATTANAVQFGDRGSFSASVPEFPSELLTVNPSAFLFNQVPIADIAYNPLQPGSPTSPTLGLRVPNGQQLLLLGGNININRGTLLAPGGRVDIGSVAGIGAVDLNADQSLRFPNELARADVTLSDRARVDVTSTTGGSIGIHAQNLEISGISQLTSGVRGVSDQVGRRSGDIVIHATGTTTIIGSTPSEVRSSILNTVQAGATGQGGDIDITTNSLRVAGGAQLNTSISGQGNAGNITINARDSVSFEGGQGEGRNFTSSLAYSRVENAANAATGGTIAIRARTLSVTDGAFISASTNGRGNAGNVILDADQIRFSGVALDREVASGAYSQVLSRGNGQGGRIVIRADSLALDRGAVLATNIRPNGVGEAGEITIDAQTISFDGEQESSSFIYSGAYSDVSAGGVGNAGNINIRASLLSLTNGAVIRSSSAGRGNAGNVAIAADQVLFNSQSRLRGQFRQPSGIFTTIESSGVGQAGSVLIETGSLFVTRGGAIDTGTFGRGGDGGTIVINARDRVVFDGPGLSPTPGRQPNTSTANSRAERLGGQERGGSIFITAGSLEVTNGAGISTTSSGDRDAGLLDINVRGAVILSGNGGGLYSQTVTGTSARAGTINVNAQSLIVRDGARIASVTFDGQGGTVNITASDSVIVSGMGGLASRIITETDGSGPAGNITISTDRLVVERGAYISSTTYNTGNAGTITINAPDLVLVDAREIAPFESFSRIISESQYRSNTDRTRDLGNAGTLRIATEQLEIRNGAAIAVSSQGSADAGNLQVTARSIWLHRQGRLGADTESGRGGNVELHILDSLRLHDGSSISALTQNEQGGRVTINVNQRAVDSIELSGASRISTEATGVGNAGNLTINTRQLAAEGRGTAISAVTRSGTGGNIAIDAEQVIIQSGAEISASTQTGQAGNLRVDAAESVVLRERGTLSVRAAADGGVAGDLAVNTRNLTVQNRAAIAAATTSGRGGNITLNTERTSLTDGAEVTARTGGQGNAGNITMLASDRFSARDSNVTTAAESSSGGDINLRAGDIRLLGDSDITTNVTSGAGNGGNINLTARSILAFDDSDIIASARAGAGGNITLDTPAFFAQNYRPAPEGTNPDTLDGNDRVDINASGAIAGVITLPDVTFIQNSLTELPDSTINPETLVANSCIARSREQDGSFVITGTGGLPVRPGDAAISAYPTGTVHTIPQDSTTHESHRPWQLGDAIAEPQGVYQLPDGRLVMSRECT